MREGPLAALFRKTEADEEHPPQAGPPERRAERLSPDSPREPEPPHPGLSPQPRSEERTLEEPNVPTPRERLRHAFSSTSPRT
jgi:hypothetical protein